MNLLLLSVDSLRWDMVSRTHPQRLITPRFNAATADFAFTDRCFSVSTATRPVHQSVFSGLYPFEHGITGQHRRRRRRGIPTLLQSFRDIGYRTMAFSEAASILGGVDLGAPVQVLDADPETGLRQLGTAWSPEEDEQVLFVHYWSTHAPYGAADGRALGETARLVRSGAAETVIERYQQAVVDCYETKLAPLISSLDPTRWAVVLFGDHGERWVPEELYHGQTLHHDVLRIPLFLHVPFRRIESMGPICSLIDLEPTIRSLFGLGRTQGLGRDLLTTPGTRDHRYLAQIEPTPDRAGGDDLVITTESQPAPGDESHQVWAVFDAVSKATIRDPTATIRDPTATIREPAATIRDSTGHVSWSAPLDPHERPIAAAFDAQKALADIIDRSSFTGAAFEDGIGADALTARLRDLGYLS